MKIGEVIKVSVKADELYSSEPKILVNIGEIYQIKVNKKQYWKDSFVTTNPDGFFNPLLFISGRRVKGVKCFCLCATINANEENHFKIGSGIHEFKIEQQGTLFFFPNDSINHYRNNSGSISLEIKRIN
ncbi:MAG: hypothetical protein ACOVO2_07095 [Emticicia sp.]|uniref:hypothetical protein n=1 Tax=Emticicia sp. TaxID=1930953 RepID=UPI003BA44D97